jgi:hypothetical protein
MADDSGAETLFAPTTIEPAAIGLNFSGRFESQLHGQRRRSISEVGAVAREAQAGSKTPSSSTLRANSLLPYQ